MILVVVLFRGVQFNIRLVCSLQSSKEPHEGTESKTQTTKTNPTTHNISKDHPKNLKTSQDNNKVKRISPPKTHITTKKQITPPKKRHVFPLNPPPKKKKKKHTKTYKNSTKTALSWRFSWALVSTAPKRTERTQLKASWGEARPSSTRRRQLMVPRRGFW